jgi:hypothetical protein
MTSPDAKVRKQVYELSSQDLIDCPVWAFCSDEEDVEGQDEATVRPTEKGELLDELPGAFVVAADVEFADGSSALGYLYNCEDRDIGCVQPNVFTDLGQVNLWLGWLQFIADAPERVQAGYSKIGKSKEAIFPLSFRSRVHINGKALQVVLRGFMALGIDRKPMIVD